MKTSSILLKIIALIGTLIILVSSSFTPWSQVTDFYNLTPSSELDQITSAPDKAKIPSYLFTLNYYHHPRASIFYPIVMIHRITKINFSFLFKIYTSIFLGICIYFQSLSLTSILKSDDETFYNILFIHLPVFIFISQFMNGRLAYAFTGFSILNYILLYSHKISLLKSLSLYLLSGYLCTVSSGSFLCYHIIIISHFIYYKKNAIQYSSCLWAILLATPLSLTSIIKNLTYTNFSIIKILKHGWGVNLGLFLLFLAVFVFLIAYVKFKHFIKKGITRTPIIISASLISIPLSVMGTGIFFCQIPNHLLTASIVLNKLKQKIIHT